jgi:sterol desaturase/sphingolipid hydroxylase (fatty acid hydroxylase superfamily)
MLSIIIAAVLYSSFIEYCLHRFVQHRSNEIDHIKKHHRIFHGVRSYEAENVQKEDILLDAKGILLNGVLYLLPSFVVFTQNKGLGVLFIAVCFFYNLWEECVHFYSHKSSNIFLEKLELFKRLKEHHRVHHYIYNSNYGIGTELWDVVFRTKKTADGKLEAKMIKNY